MIKSVTKFSVLLSLLGMFVGNNGNAQSLFAEKEGDYRLMQHQENTTRLLVKNSETSGESHYKQLMAKGFFDRLSFFGGTGLGYFLTSGVAESPAITIRPRLNFSLSDKISVSADVHLAFGFWFGNEGAYAMWQIPLAASFNYGFGANKDMDETFGVFGTLGYATSFIGAATIEGSGANRAKGIYLAGGIRGNLFDWKPFSLRFSYLINTLSESDLPEDQKSSQTNNVFGIGIVYYPDFLR